MLDNEGLMFVPNTGKVKWYCSSKCRKNEALKRVPRKLKWIKE